VNDEPFILVAFEQVLQQFQGIFSWECADSGQKALRKVKASFEEGQRQFDLILLDIRMPGIDGF